MKFQKINIYPYNDLFEKIKKKCEEEDRSFNNFVLKVLKDYFESEVRDG